MDGADGLEVMDRVADALDGTRTLLGAVGLAPSPFEAQLALLLFCIIAVAGLRSVWRRFSAARLPTLLASGALAVVAFVILANWATLWLDPPPDHVAGVVEGGHPPGLRVTLLDASGVPLPRADAPVDDVNGRFVVRWQAPFGDWPRRLRAARSDCPPVERPITLSQIRSGQTIRIDYSCGAAG